MPSAILGEPPSHLRIHVHIHILTCCETAKNPGHSSTQRRVYKQHIHICVGLCSVPVRVPSANSRSDAEGWPATLPCNAHPVSVRFCPFRWPRH